MMKPREFGKYLLLDRLAVGGMAEVFIARASGIEGVERFVAIKKILPTMAEDEEFIRMFIDEARISVQLNHANIVHLHELDKEDDSYFIAMEYVPGRDVRAMLEYYRDHELLMPISEAVFIASKICEGLHYAHTRKDARGQPLGIIHRDVSPQNILVSYEGEVKIIDFGIAKAANRSQKTQAGILKGKFGYMSPEQVRGLPIDRRSDIFAVGALLFEMLTGERLFTGESDFSVLSKVREGQVPPPRELNADIPAGLEKVLLKALAKEADERYAWAADFQSDLTRFLLDGDRIYTARELSASMKELFADEIRKEAARMEGFARAADEAVNPFDGISAEAEPEDDGSGKTQLIDASVVAGLGLSADEEGPSGEGESEATRFDAVNPFFKEEGSPEVASAAVPTAGQKVVIGDEAEAYAGATVIGPMPTADAPNSARQNGPARLQPAGITRTTRQSPQASPSSERAALVPGPDDTGPIAQPPSGTFDSDEVDAAGDEQDEEAYDDELGPEGDEAYAEDEPYDDGAEGDAEPEHGTVEDDPLEDEPEEDTASHSAAKPAPPAGTWKDRLSEVRARLPRWAPYAAVAGVAVVVLGILAVALLGGGPKTQPLIVQVTGAHGALVTLDGRMIPGGQVTQVAPGRHEVAVTAQGFPPIKRSIDVRADQPPPVVRVAMRRAAPAPTADHGAPAPPAQEGTPKPSGAPSPSTATPTEVAAKAPMQKAVEKPEEPSAPTPPPTAEVRFHSQSKGVEIAVEGKRIGRTPDARVADLAVGRTYHYQATRAGYHSHEGSFTPSRPGEMTVTFALEKIAPKPPPVVHHHHHERVAHHRTVHHRAARAFGALACASRPNGAQVWVDHHDTGRTTPVAPGRPIRLSVGTHLVRFKLGGRQSEVRKVVISKGDTARLVMPLQ